MKKLYVLIVGVFLSFAVFYGTDRVMAAETVSEDALQDPEYEKYCSDSTDTYEDEKDYARSGKQEELYGAASGSNRVLGFDVSKWQGNIDWNKAKNAGINFAFIRVGNRGRIDGQIYDDPCFAQNIQGALSVGIPVGVYFFSEAISTDEAIQEADFVLSRISMYNISLPVVIDYEGFTSGHRVFNAGLHTPQLNSIVSAFCDRVASHGYRTAIYSSASYFEPKNPGEKYYLDGTELCKKYCIWTAAYSATPDKWNKNTVYEYWQFTSRANGFDYGTSSNSLDLDYAYNWNGLCNVNGSLKYYSNGEFNSGHSGLDQYWNDWYKVKNGVVDSTYTGLYYWNNYWWYVNSGKVDFDYDGVIGNENGWWKVKDGKVDFTFNGLSNNQYGCWKLVNGKVDFGFTGLANNVYGDWYCQNGKVQTGLTDVIYVVNDQYKGWYYVKNGKVQTGKETVQCNKNGWWYIGQDGRVDFTKNTVAENQYGWWKTENGKVNFNFNGIASNQYGDWYCQGSKVQFGVTDVIYCDNNQVKGWYYVKNGQIQKGQETVQCNKNGWWYIGKDGKVDFTKNTVALNQNGWWYIENGKVDFNFNGLACNQNGWWKIENGKVNFDFNGIASNQYGDWYCRGSKVQFDKTDVVYCDNNKFKGWYYIKNGQIQYNSETVQCNKNGWWYIGKDGKVNFDFNGIAHNQNGDWFIRNGKVDFTYNNNNYEWNGKIYNIINGKVS